jgi:hypothetical protein
VWLIYRAGADRVFTSTVQPTVEQRAAYRRDGFDLFRAQVYLPVDGATQALEITPATVEMAAGAEWPRPSLVPDQPRVLTPAIRLLQPPERQPEPERKIILCPNCNERHYDDFDPETGIDWSVRPHRKHLCLRCKHVWQEADHYTTGV